MKYIEIKEKDNSYSYFYYIPHFLDKEYVRILTLWLDKMDDFKCNTNYNEDRVIRYQKWYQAQQRYFCNQWVVKYNRWNAFSYDNTLQQLEDYIRNKLIQDGYDTLGIDIPSINSVLIQKYMDGSQYISAHRDTDMSFGHTPTILNISLGDSRDIIFKRVMYNGSNKKMSKLDKKHSHLNMKFTLEKGSLLIMAGNSQKYWTHQINREQNKTKRYSLTFRELL